MKIAVIGATRGIGLALVRAALADGHEVRALVRAPSAMPIKAPKLTVVKGDATNAADVAGFVAGQDVVCDCLGTRKVTETVTMFSRSAQSLAAALRPEQLLIAVTGIGAGDSKGAGGFFYDRIFLPLVLKRMYADKDAQERIIKGRIARWIIVRPGRLTNGPHTGTYRALTDLRGIRGGTISREDVADFLLKQAKSPEFLNQTPLLIYLSRATHRGGLAP